MGRAARRRRRQEEQDNQALQEMAEQDGGLPQGIEFRDDLPELMSVDQDPDEESDGADPDAVDPWKAARMGSVKKVAGLFGVHFKTVEVWRRKHGLPCVRIRGVIRYDLSDVLRWASARKEGV
jgi:hypothetical protein